MGSASVKLMGLTPLSTPTKRARNPERKSREPPTG